MLACVNSLFAIRDSPRFVGADRAWVYINMEQTSFAQHGMKGSGLAPLPTGVQWKIGSTLGSRFCTKDMISEVTSRASLPYLAAIHHSHATVCLYVAHITALWPSGPTGTFGNSVLCTKCRAQDGTKRRHLRAPDKVRQHEHFRCNLGPPVQFLTSQLFPVWPQLWSAAMKALH